MMMAFAWMDHGHWYFITDTSWLMEGWLYIQYQLPLRQVMMTPWTSISTILLSHVQIFKGELYGSEPFQ